MTPVSDGIREMAPGGFHHQGPDAPSAHRRPSYPLSGCVPAEPDSVSPGAESVTGNSSARQARLSCGSGKVIVVGQRIVRKRIPVLPWAWIVLANYPYPGLHRDALFFFEARGRSYLENH